ncbi:glycosyltransferase [Rubrobacter tropicus]|uniref:glycosyltransferase n=1 Tax=Rubrobacter tropicus TaxID=2653851 RepID=UPI001408D7F9|nr:glycosyltransferase family 2 protein [Rubrobacter tropicus]
MLLVLGSAGWLAACGGWFRGVRRVPVLSDVGGQQDSLDEYPSVSVVLAARDEGAEVGEAVRSVLEQDYPGRLEVVAVDDRSTDRTGEIFTELAAEYPESLKPLRVDCLPEGWLGKNHALYLGAKQAEGEWLLFTDADVRFAPGCVGDAVRYALRERLDHLTLSPELISRGVALKSFVAAFVLVFEVTQRPWRAADPGAKEAVGVGSFNLLKREAYLASGTHRAIRLRPDDDMRLARMLKEAGFSQGVAYGTGSISVEWHRSLAGAVRGLEKSIFPGLDYRLSTALVASFVLFLINVAPFFGTLFARRPAVRAICFADVLAVVAMYVYGPRISGSKLSPLYAALHPFGAGALIYATLRSAAVTLARGGVEWRDTFYPLDLLKNAP